MGKPIANIHNYPLSDGSVPYGNPLLLGQGFALRTAALNDYLKTVFEFSKDIRFFNELGEATHTWNDLLAKDAVFQLARVVTVPAGELDRFFKSLPITNRFTDDTMLSEEEYATLAYQRLQLLQFLLSFFRDLPTAVEEESRPAVLAMLRSNAVGQLFVAYRALLTECLAGGSPLVAPASRKAVAPLADLRFEPVEDDTTGALNNYYNPTNLAGTPVLAVYSNAYDQLKAANEYAYTLFRGLLRVLQTFTQWALGKLRDLSESTPTHQPHVGLLLAFARLLRLYDARFNQLIPAHTDFVFRYVLQLKEEPERPDTAYVHLELAKNVSQYFLARDTRFKAGKNSENKPLYYRAVNDVVLNGATIAAFRSTVLLRQGNGLFSVAATGDAASPEWQVNNAWMPFNDLAESYTGMAIESKLLAAVEKKDTSIALIFRFGSAPPATTGLAESARVALVLETGTEEALTVSAVTLSETDLKITATLSKDLKEKVRTGLNVRVRWVSPQRDAAANNPYVLFYGFLLQAELARIAIELPQQTFNPTGVRTSAGLLPGSASFPAFGTQSLAGTSFRLYHPFIRYAATIDLTIQWAEKLKASVAVSVQDVARTLPANSATSTLNDVANGSRSSVKVELEADQTYTVTATHSSTGGNTTVETMLPRVLLVKEVSLTADLQEVAYEKENSGAPQFTEELLQRPRIVRSLYLATASKAQQKIELHQRHQQYRIRIPVIHRNNRTAHLYPFGERAVNKATGLTLLPDYAVLGYADFVADFYIGLRGIQPGQTVSLLFNMAEETAAQSGDDATIKWYTIADNSFEALDPSRVIDTTQNFLQSGLVQVMLPDTATTNNTLVEGEGLYWLVARCDKHYDVVANIRGVYTNGVAVERVLDESNTETKASVAPGTVEQLFPKTAAVKTVTQETPSFNGREKETEAHYFWRSSQRLRHKRRGINQWDLEQLVLEKFPAMYKVRCLNHAFYDEESTTLLARPAHTVISVIPFYVVNEQSPNFQPAITLSKLKAIEDWLRQKSSPFLQFQVVNAFWDVVSVQLDAVLAPDVQDLLYYRQQLNTDLQWFFSPWAFTRTDTPPLQTRIFLATLVDYIDELPYVHHIKGLRVFRNGQEVADEILTSSQIHLLTTAAEHTLTVFANGQ
ncbi:hypothetical protein SAMN05444008_105191 [Cnuella takakiae]|uniref:Baseplate J-like protein n=1 Tax=Cnuella takakiae TaxID=1302690 RepID=A0A1M4ZES3_9BACT|nr:hypothetical protein [Cnuella takakiae]OLY94237.1 hypothetical protein BUE76_21880 [Cnuella takakiae]SHF16292.1 hypothetical protein SAMN05444008_105191 [Cnuella takakiae]